MSETRIELDTIAAELEQALKLCHPAWLGATGFDTVLRPFLQRAFDLGARSGGVSERALIEAQREAFMFARATGPTPCQALAEDGKCSHCLAESRRAFPMPVEDCPPAPCSSRGSLNDVMGPNGLRD